MAPEASPPGRRGWHGLVLQGVPGGSLVKSAGSEASRRLSIGGNSNGNERIRKWPENGEGGLRPPLRSFGCSYLLQLYDPMHW